MGLGDLVESAGRWVAVTEEARTCPECGGDMARDYARDPAFQSHWRGVEADVCEACGYAERLGENPNH